MTALLHCPFCGSADAQLGETEQVELNSWVASVTCGNCNARVEPGYATRPEPAALAEAVALWNNRTVPANCKPSSCCPGELLVPMHSTDTKMCTGCKTEKHWPLEPGQKRTFE